MTRKPKLPSYAELQHNAMRDLAMRVIKDPSSPDEHVETAKRVLKQKTAPVGLAASDPDAIVRWAGSLPPKLALSLHRIARELAEHERAPLPAPVASPPPSPPAPDPT